MFPNHLCLAAALCLRLFGRPSPPHPTTRPPVGFYLATVCPLIPILPTPSYVLDGVLCPTGRNCSGLLVWFAAVAPFSSVHFFSLPGLTATWLCARPAPWLITLGAYIVVRLLCVSPLLPPPAAASFIFRWRIANAPARLGLFSSIVVFYVVPSCIPIPNK